MKHRSTLFLLALLLFGVALQFAGAAQKSLWEDEAWTAQMILESPDVPGLIRTVTTRDIHPPLYTLSSFLWVQSLGLSEVRLRSLSILCIALVLGLSFKLASETLGRRAAWFTTALLACSPLLVMYGHNARYYAMSAFLALLVALSTYYFQRSGRAIYLVPYIAGGAALLYVVYTAASVLVACCLWYIFAWSRRQPALGKLLLWSVAQAVIVALFLPWVPVLRASMEAEVGPAAALSAFELVKRAGYVGVIFSVGETIALFSPVAWLGLALTVGVALFAVFKIGRPSPVWLPFLFLLTTEGANLAINLAMTEPAFQNLPHRTLYAFPFFAMILGYGLSRMGRRTGIVVCALLLGVYGVGLTNYFTYRQFLKPTMQVPWRDIMRQIEAEATDDAVVICSVGDTSCGFYVRRYNFNRMALNDLRRPAGEKPSQIWWIQQNIAQRYYNKQGEQDLLASVTAAYQSTAVTNYGLHDPVVRRVKNALLDERDDYDYRINLQKFSEPLATP